ncbi:hypothetical protein [Hafnia psychrotolerans]|uniref:Type VI secretion protein n=1 Tax=Hafnia psychrotolerans TaxID=1477018 RepID=A0ABQ1FV61_9GAMM|nr:hypothetical protein [Hafnia psychrotolerans]GGA29698.1 hypothetical protein GCM10011328_00190 [Hafnia psychrotolerans]
MNHPPRYPDYADIHHARWRRWWVALPVILFLSAMATMLLWPEGKPTRTPSFWFWSLVLPLLLWLIAVAGRWLVWLVALYNRNTYQVTIAESLDAWWQYRSRTLPVEHVLLVTPLGDEDADHEPLLSSSLPPTPLQSTDASGSALLRCSQVLGMQSRSVLLARYLARRLLTQFRQNDEARPVQVFCWLGDDDSLAAFTQALESDGMRLPDDVIRMDDASKLDNVTDAMPQDEQALMLCAGCGEGEADNGSVAGEGAFAWLCGHQALALMYRAEILNPDAGETPQQLVGQLSRYARLNAAPERVIAADKTAMDTLLPSGWSAVDHVLTPWLGHAGAVTPFIVLSLAALSARNGQACGWTASLMDNQLMTGVCVPRGNLPH